MVMSPQYLKKTENTEDMYYSTPLKFKDVQRTTFHKLNHASQNNANTYHEYKLPINLFYTAAEYNKILITNGKSVRKKSQPIIQDYINTLQFINEPIFQFYQKNKQLLKKQQKQKKHASSVRYPAQSLTQDCMCCCCEEYCQICTKEQSNKCNDKMNQQHLEKMLKKISEKAVKVRKNKKKVVNPQINPQNKISKYEKMLKGCSNQLQKEFSNSYISYLSHKNCNIGNLIYKSLTQFETKKRKDEVERQLEKQKKMQHLTLMKKFDQEVRLKNRSVRSLSKSKKHDKKVSESKNSKGIQYWKNVRGIIIQALSKQKLLKKSKFFDKINKSEQNCNHRVFLLPEQIVFLAYKHEQQAKEKIAKQYRQTLAKSKKISDNLQQLQKQRRKHLNSCKKKIFQPTEQMINEAFQPPVSNQQQIVPIQTVKAEKNNKKLKKKK